MKQKAKRSIALLLAFAMVFTFASVLGACGTKHECGHVCEICQKCTSDCTDPVCKDKCQGHTVAPTAITVNPATVSLKVGEKSAKPTLTFTPSDAAKTVSWKSENTAVATVDNDGIITAVAAGNTKVTATSTVANTVKAEISVAVTAEPAPHVCGHVCPTCGKCTDNTCTDPVCADKCPGHGETKDFTPLTSPQAGTYYMGMKCGDNAYHYITGNMSGYYMETTTDVASAATVDLIADGEGWLMKCGTNYIEIELSGTHINAVYKAARSAGKHWTWDTANSVFVWTENSKLYFLGTYGTFTTVGGGDYATHISDNYKAVLGTFGSGPIEKPDPESVTLNKTGKVYLAPQAGNYIQLNATVEPSAAAQDIVWASSNEQAATVENGKVTYVGAGETVISATAKDTAIKAEVTIVVTDKGSKEQPLSVDEAIALMDTAGDGVTLGDANNKFYITGKVEEGSLCDRTNGAEWTVNLLGADEKKLQCIFEHSNPVGQLAGPENGKLDNCTLVLQVSLKKDSSAYTVVEATFESGVRPAVASIKIIETAEVKMPIHAKLNVTEVLPANAQLDGTEQWHSSDESKATVDNKGEVTGVSAGEVQVWVSLGEVESNKCTVTITEQEKGNKIVFDWTSKLTDDTVVDNLYVTAPSKRKDHLKDYLGSWTPGQEEITAITFGNQCNLSSDCDGFGYVASAEAGKVDMTTAHEIKKVTFTIIPYSDAQNVEFTLNGKSVKETRQDTWNGKKASAITVTVDLDTATNTLAFEAPNNAGNKFFIVGMTLETAAQASTMFAFDWTSKLTDDTVVDNLYVTAPSKRKDHLKDYLGSWTPGQEEITAITFGNQCNLSSDCDGFGYVASAEAGKVDMTTAHEIKKVTFTIIPYSDAQNVEFTLNGKSVKETRQDTWNGKKASAITVTVDLDTATNTLAFEAPNNAGNKFFIVGMTLAW